MPNTLLDNLSSAELTAWLQVPLAPLDLFKQANDAAVAARAALRGVYTSAPVGIWWSAETVKYAVCRDDPAATAADLAIVKSALTIAGPVVVDPSPGIPGTNVKLTYSETLKAAGDRPFFPIKYGAEEPDAISSMLLSGLIGAGIGYRRQKTADDVRTMREFAGTMIAGDKATDSLIYQSVKQASYLALEMPPALVDVQTDMRFTSTGNLDRFVEKTADEDFAPGSAPAINVDSLGRTLWQTGSNSNPQLASTTMGALIAASQMPGGTGDSGWVTPVQMAELAARMGVGYMSGAIVGHTLGILTGLPEAAQDELKRTGAYVGVVQGVIPRLFGR